MHFLNALIANCILYIQSAVYMNDVEYTNIRTNARLFFSLSSSLFRQKTCEPVSLSQNHRPLMLA
jgi:hypothetical protein